MAIQFSAAARNAILDAIETYGGTTAALEIRTLSPPATCATAGTGTVLVTINLPSDWMQGASSGSKAKSATAWTDASADASGTAGHFRVYNDQSTKDNTTCFMQGTVDQGSGDLSLDNKILVAGQAVTISTFTISASNA